MEAVGARLGRSSSRYGATTVFNGPVRKWRKKWVHVAPPSNHHNAAYNYHHHHASLANGGGNASPQLLLYKWTPISQSNKENSNSNSNNKYGEDKNPSSKEENPDSAPSEAPPKRKFRYVPVAALEEQKKDAEENTDDEAKPADTDTNAAEPTSKSDGHDEKPDINDIPMEDDQAPEKYETVTERQDLNESTLDLSLGLTSEPGSDPKLEPTKDGQ